MHGLFHCQYGSDIDFEIDMGADISVISENTFSSLKFKDKLSNVNAKKSPGGKLHCIILLFYYIIIIFLLLMK